MSDNDLVQEAKEFATRAIEKHRDPNRARSEINKKYAKELSAKPDVRDIRSQRISEIAGAYLGVADGKGGVDRDSSPQAKERWERTLKGLGPGTGNELAQSQRMALQLGDKGTPFITEHVQHLSGRYQPRRETGHSVTVGHNPRTSFANSQRGSVTPGLLGKMAVGAVAVVGALAGGKVSAAEITDSVVPGANVSGEKTLCRQFGEVSGVIAGAAAGIVTAPVVTPLGGVAVGFAVDAAAGKLTDLACGPE